MLTKNESYRRVQMPHANQTVEVIIRPIKPTDAPVLQIHYNRLSSESVFYRFHGFKKELTEEAQRLCMVDGHYQAAVVAIRTQDQPTGQPDEIEGVARYYLTEPGIAEVAVVVCDSYQGHGLGKALLEELIKIALHNDIDCLDALVLVKNWHMRHLVHHIGYPLTTKTSGPVVAVRVHLDGFAPVSASKK